MYHELNKGGSVALRQQALLLANIRKFFADKNVLEVQTPLLYSGGTTDPYIKSFEVNNKYLQTSPEFAMKRLLCHGTGDIYQICKAFRHEEQEGPWHSHEFTMLEWYRLGFSLDDLINEVCDLVLTNASFYKKDNNRIEKYSYQEIFQKYLNLDPLEIKFAELKNIVQKHINLDFENLNLSQTDLLQLLISHTIEPEFADDTLTVIYNFPKEQAALAKINPEDHRTALRFEVFLGKIELANGYNELVDWQEQEKRFKKDNEKRQSLGLPEVQYDQQLINDMREFGLPECSGVALGVDRLFNCMISSTSTTTIF